MFRIAKDFSFSASHQLDHLPDTHPCARLHGHNYRVTVICAAETLDHNGMVIDFRMLDCIKRWIDDELDHRHLNDVFHSARCTTSENIAKHIYDRWSSQFDLLAAVRVSETEKTWAEYDAQ